MISLEQTLAESMRLARMPAGELIAKIRLHTRCIVELTEALASADAECERMRRIIDAQAEIIAVLKSRGGRLTLVEKPS